jgi:hypothetical protein
MKRLMIHQHQTANPNIDAPEFMDLEDDEGNDTDTSNGKSQHDEDSLDNHDEDSLGDYNMSSLFLCAEVAIVSR